MTVDVNQPDVGAASATKKQRQGFQKGQSGNPAGRKPGTRNKATVLAQSLIDEQSGTIVRRAIELAAGGDVSCIRMVLDRLVPPRRNQPVNFTLPTKPDGGIDIGASVAEIARATGTGEIGLDEAETILKIIDAAAKHSALEEIENRLQALEAVNGNET